MAEEELPPQEEAARKSGLAEQWQKLANWQKAGVLIGAGVLVIAVVAFVNQQQAPVATGNDQFMQPAGSQTGIVPGSNEQFPPVPVPPTPQGPPSPVSPVPPDVTGGFKTPPIIQHTQNYTVRGGDTLSSIAGRFGTTWQQLYSQNQQTIQSTAQQRGVQSNFQNFIYPGENLKI